MHHKPRISGLVILLKMLSVFFTVVLILLGSVNAKEEELMNKTEFILRPIGLVHKEKAQATLILNKEFEPALLGLDGFSHVWVFYWFDRNDTPKKRSTLQVHPKRDRTNPLTGVFACRSPARPNLIGVSLCRVVSVKGNVVEIDKITRERTAPCLARRVVITHLNGC